MFKNKNAITLESICTEEIYKLDCLEVLIYKIIQWYSGKSTAILYKMHC